MGDRGGTAVGRIPELKAVAATLLLSLTNLPLARPRLEYSAR